MSAGSEMPDQVRAALQPHGLFVRGVVKAPIHPELMPSPLGDIAIKTVLLIGAVGGSNWQAFRSWQASRSDMGGQHPLDSWSKSVLRPLAATFDAHVWFPSDPPWQPFQKWAMSAEGLQPSPLGILIHPEFGLWHSYRGALGFSFEIPDGEVSDRPHPCDHCADKPCLTSCPVSAVTMEGFQLNTCRTYLKTDAGQGLCVQSGCVARNACPVGAQHRYGADQLRFHMAALG